MPFVGEDANSDRKRRWNDVDDEHHTYALYSPDEPRDFFVFNPLSERPARKVLPMTKRARIAAADDDDDLAPPSSSCCSPASTSTSLHHSHRRRRSSQLRTTLQVQPSLPSLPSRTPSRTALAPCHICHRRPTKKSDLDSFAECQGCGERTCFVCIRQCHGWNLDGGEGLSEQEVLSRSFQMDDVDDTNNNNNNNPTCDINTQQRGDQQTQTRQGWYARGHQGVVCSRCCVERGVEGDVACLGCLARIEGS